MSVCRDNDGAVLVEHTHDPSRNQRIRYMEPRFALAAAAEADWRAKRGLGPDALVDLGDVVSEIGYDVTTRRYVWGEWSARADQ